MMPQIGYYSNIPGWVACQIGKTDGHTYKCALCGKWLKSGDWALVSDNNWLLFCGVMDHDHES